ncbi:MAG: rod shape-determining protein RodA [Alistipes sp.]|nr:rod shape-determining protein RodA [Alistipes sp.]MBO5399238.1 rod shape-determining protein RodA [Alistipes sp.]
MQQNNQISLFGGVDRVAVLLYLLLVATGLLCITSVSFEEPEITEFFSFSRFHIKQAIWAAAASVVAIVILLLDSRYFHMYAYYAYALGVLLIFGTIVLPESIAPTFNGAKAWYSFGSFAVQPVEFTKITVALAVARLMSNYDYSIRKIGDMAHVAAIILLPLAIIILQNDTGSGVVLCSFIIVLYREGLNNWICIPLIMVATLFIFSFLFTPLILLLVLVLLFTLSSAMMVGRWRTHIVFVAGVLLAAMLLYAVGEVIGWDLSGYNALVICSLAGAALAAVYAIRKNLTPIFLSLLFFIGSMVFVPTADKIFESVLQPHQKERILSFLGIVNDPKGADYNVTQAKIAIGSGGLVGKGFMQGTQNRYFVPEKETDFIFTTVGEEWGFVGSAVVLTLLCAMILRLMKMGERQQEPFSRIYCYCVASVLLFHVMVNVGMNVGLMPVMGIPLPFLSYGGSSLVAFTILVFIAIRLDASPTKGLSALQ